MSITGMNHAVLYVRDADVTAAFYRDLLGFRDVRSFPGGRFLQAPGSVNDHDVAFFTLGTAAGPSRAGQQTVGLYHIAWQVETLQDLVECRDRLTAAGALVGSSDHESTKSLYAHDPDGLEFEVMWLVPRHLLDPARSAAVVIEPLDLDAEIARYGATTPS
jgi:catechol-2,3-dioxygenase